MDISLAKENVWVIRNEGRIIKAADNEFEITNDFRKLLQLEKELKAARDK